METEQETPKEKKHSIWFLAGYYFRKVVAWFFILIAPTEIGRDLLRWDDTLAGGGIFVLAGVYLLVNTKKE